MSYTPLTPIGHFMPLYSFHDGNWYSSFWLRAHDAFHEARYVRTFERMACDVSDSSISRYKNLSKMNNYLELITRILDLVELEDLSEEQRVYIYLHLFMTHEVDFTKGQGLDVDLLEIDQPFVQVLKEKHFLCMLQDLLFRLNIQIADSSQGGRELLPGKYKIDKLLSECHAIYEKIKRKALIAHINEHLSMVSHKDEMPI